MLIPCLAIGLAICAPVCPTAPAAQTAGIAVEIVRRVLSQRGIDKARHPGVIAHVPAKNVEPDDPDRAMRWRRLSWLD